MATTGQVTYTLVTDTAANLATIATNGGSGTYVTSGKNATVSNNASIAQLTTMAQQLAMEHLPTLLKIRQATFQPTPVLISLQALMLSFQMRQLLIMTTLIPITATAPSPTQR